MTEGVFYTDIDFSIPLRYSRKERSDGIASKQMRLVRASMTLILFLIAHSALLSKKILVTLYLV
ncbi:MAG: hypothetical protein K2O31_06240, partial [Clostridia bacterium]|nr:hypothetical protein [Clostridia bacterium]